MRHVVVAMLLGAAAFLLYSARLDFSPMYLCHDEVVYAVNAQSIATTGRDVNGRLLPLYFHVGGNFWATPINIYVMSLFLKAFGVTERIIRTPSAAIGALNVVLLFFVGRRLLGSALWGAVAAALLALTPAHFIHSRLATDHIYALPFVLGWLLCLLDFWECDRLGSLFVATALLGVGVYTYLASFIMMPVYFMITAIMIYRKGARTARPYAVALAGFVLPLILLVPWLLTHPSQYADQVRMYSLYDSRRLNPLQGLKEILSHTGLTARTDVYYNFFNPSFLFFSGDSSYINATRQAGVFPYAFALLLPVGAYAILAERRTPLNQMLLAGFLCAPIAAVLVTEVKINRALVILPFASLIATIGLSWMADRPRRVWLAIAVATMVAVPMQFRSFYANYMGDYRLISGYWFESNIRGAIEEVIRRNPPGAGHRVYLSTDIQWIDWYMPLYLVKERRDDLRSRAVYFDPKTIVVSTVPEGSTIVERSDTTSVHPFAAAGPPRNVAPILEPNGISYFAVFDR